MPRTEKLEDILPRLFDLSPYRPLCAQNCQVQVERERQHLRPQRLGKRPAQGPEESTADVRGRHCKRYAAPLLLIEPRYSDTHSTTTPHPAPNSNHPGPAAYFSLCGISDTNPPIDAASKNARLNDLDATAPSVLTAVDIGINNTTEPFSGTGTIQPITVTVNKRDLKHDTYTGKVTISGDGLAPVNIPVTLIVVLS